MKASSVSLFIMLVLAIQLCCSPAILTRDLTADSGNLESVGLIYVAYEDSGPIVISGNDDFAAQAALEGWPGDGSSGTPYVIGSLNITIASETMLLVNVTDTSVYFRLESCLLVGGSAAVYFDNVSYGSVVDTSIEGCAQQGIIAMGSHHISIFESEIHDIGEQGVSFNQVNDSVIENSTIEECGDRGVLMDYSLDCVVSSTEIMRCSNGATAFRDSEHCTLYNNTVLLNSGNAITLGHAPFCDILENTIVNCTGKGVSVESSANATLAGNVICNATVVGVGVEGSQYCIIRNNTFYRNEFRAARIQSDNGQILGNNFVDNSMIQPAVSECANEGSNNQFDFNFWSRWLTPDTNADGYVDSAYDVGGGAYDQHPRTRVYLTDRIHLVTRPILLNPNGSIADQRVWGEISVEWAPSSDTFGHGVAYSLQYSSDGGQSWTEAVSGLTQMHYDWNSSTVAEGEYYRLRVKASCSAGLASSDSPGFSLQVLEHKLTGLRVTYPNGGETLSGGITVTWEQAIDSYGHDITYTVYISRDGGSTWSQLKSVANTNRTDIGGSFSSGSDYLLKIVALCTGALEIEDVSDAPFTISSWVELYAPMLIVVVAAAVIVVAVIFLKKR